MKIDNFSEMLEAIHKDRGIPKEALIEAIRMALLSAAKKMLKSNEENVEVKLAEDGLARIYVKKKAVKKVTDENLEIGLKEAKKIKPKVKEGDEVEIESTPSDFGRLAAQTAKQVVIQRIREAEKEETFEEFHKKEGELINGTVQRREYGGYLVNLGRVETVLAQSEQIPGENYRPNDRVKLYVVEAKRTGKGPMIIVSRAHPGLVKKLFELEIPEITQGILEIKGIAREAGRRSKVAVLSHDKKIAAVGTCVGHMGSRIQNIVRELGNERVDIIEWQEEPRAFITNALSPAKIAGVEINEAEKSAKVMVPEDQLSLAIGKEGQNVRLAAKLTGYKIDIANSSGEPVKTAAEKLAKEAPPQEKKLEKIKVSAIAKETGKTAKEIIEKLKELGIEAKSAASSIAPEEKEKLIQAIKG